MAKPLIETPDPEPEPRTAPAPYLPFLTFQSAIQSLEQGVPTKIDRTIWRNQSGIVQTQILMALRFFNLVDDADVPTELLHELIEQKDNRAAIYTKLLNASYKGLLDHDLTKMTPKMLDDAMEQYNVTGDTKRKAVTFFLKAAKYASFPMHPLLSSQVRNTGPRKKKVKRPGYIPEMNGAADPAYLPKPPATNGSGKSVRLSNGGTLTLSISADPFMLPAEDRKFVFELIDKLQEYEVAHSSDEGSEEEDES
jgi:Family of unknown function (DUF5343)